MNTVIRAARVFAAEQRWERDEFEHEQFNRKYLEGGYGYAICDEVDPAKADLYRRAAGGLVGVTAIIDPAGDVVPRGTPPEGSAWAIIDPVNPRVSDAYWDVLEPMLDELERGASDV